MTRTDRTISPWGGGHPDWSSEATDVANNDVISKDGWIQITNTVSGTGVRSITASVNGIVVFDGSQSGDWYGVKDGAAVVPVNKGDVVTFTGSVSVKFYPCK